MRWTLLPCLLILGACARRPPLAFPDAHEASIYRVGVVAASGPRTVTSIYTLRVVPRAEERAWAFMTEAAEGSWEEGAAAITWSSEQPKASDPWPVTMQHAISTVPAPIRLDARGRPAELLETPSWKAAARQAVAATDLPEQALSSSEALVDPDGLLRDLARNFPGTPGADGSWVRTETIAGLPATRIETCTSERSGGATTWTCAGRIEGPTDGNARLVDATSSSVLVVDREGLRSLDHRYEGTLVVLAPDGERALDRAVAGRRKVLRVVPSE